MISGRNGICNIFFSHCNLQCLYCQNYQISRNTSPQERNKLTLPDIVKEVIHYLESGCESVGFVTPTQYLPHVHAIIDALKDAGHYPVMVYNTNGYDRPGMLKDLEEKIDIYLPDFKYMDSELAGRFSGAHDYPDVAKRSVKEMYRQKGSSLRLSETGLALNGLIIRHLVLPGFTNDSIKILRWIAEELSPMVHISLMAQYYPPEGLVCPPPLNRTLNKKEYESVVTEMEKLGFCNGWIQEPDSSGYYNPDFSNDQPFSS
ncbi:MAG: radical SAM protein [Bacteroidales bacterium]|nr:radical SAM protein [Bacteroidales bacterium]